MLQLLTAILGVLITILLVVGFHEFGHFIVARLVGVKVLRFSIGFGKILYRWHDKQGTEYALSAIPLGGYVKMVDENEETVAKEDLPFAYNRQPFLKRFAIVIAGPVFNIILAFFIYWLLFMIGFTTVIPLIGKITPHSIAENAGMKPQQEIIRVNDKPTQNWVTVVISLLTHTGDKNNLTIQTQATTDKKLYTYTLSTLQWKMNNLKPDPLESLGIEPYEPEVPAIIGKVLPDSPARAQLKVGDKIISVDKKPIQKWQDLIELIDSSPQTTLIFKVERNNQLISIPIKTSYTRDLFFKKHGMLGIVAQFHWPENLLRHNQYGPIQALSHAWEDTKNFCDLNFIIIGKLLNGKISFQSLGGPITIFESAGNALNNGVAPFLSFLAFLSISIGLINVLPIPGLDGGHVLIQVIELVIRRRISMNAQVLFYRLGMIIILLLITQALVNDILRL